MRDSRRDNLGAFTLDNDRLWIITTPEFEAALTEYNDEITGVDQRLWGLDPKVFHYGGNAYYATGRYARDKGYTVQKIEDRRIPQERRP